MKGGNRIGLIAGGGQFPRLFAKAARRAGVSVVAVGFDGETDPTLSEEVDVFYLIKLGQLGRLIECFKKENVNRAAMAGTINKTRLYSRIRPDWRAIRFALKLRNKQDDFLLRALASELESEGIFIEPSTVFLPELLAPEGILTRRRPNWRERQDIKFGWQIAKAFGNLDVGQCVVVKNQAVVAVEAIDGTDETIRRGGRLCGSGAVVVKVSKPNQDLRFDVPSVGPKTIEVMKEVGASVLVIEAGKTLVFDIDEMIKAADSNGISIVSLSSLEHQSNSIPAIEPGSEKTIIRRVKKSDAIRVAVIGTGYLGKFHAEKLAAMDEAQLVAVVDVDEKKATDTAKRLNTKHFIDYRDIIGSVQAVSIVTPTPTHFRIAAEFLKAGVHVFVEKPMTTTVKEAEALVDLAKKNDLILQVGHIERFNPAFKAVKSRLNNPLFMEVHRLSPFTERSTEVDVILDLMIHDIDLLLSIVNSEVADFKASGAAVLTDKPDIATTRLEFKNGTVANITSSRISLKSLRKMRIFQRDSYLSIDFGERRAYAIYRGDDHDRENIAYEELDVEDYDPLEEELRHFLNCVKHRSCPIVQGDEGLRALRLAEQISKAILENGVNLYING